MKIGIKISLLTVITVLLISIYYSEVLPVSAFIIFRQ